MLRRNGSSILWGVRADKQCLNKSIKRFASTAESEATPVVECVFRGM
jgi:hypothetical protein